MKVRGELLRHASKLAGEAAIKTVPTESIIEKEGRGNIVTAADLASEKVIIDLIKQNFPNDKILSEETESELQDLLSIDKLWVIDPIDGTSNFRYQRNYSCVSVGYVENGVTQLGAVYDPFHSELFYAERGQGAYLKTTKIQVSDQTNLSKATIATDNSYDPSGTRKNLELALKVNPTPWVLMKGSAVLTMCELAAGRIDLYYHTAVKPWDNAAAFLIAEEAGAVLRDYEGNQINFLSPDVIMGNQKLVEQFLSSIK